MTVEKVSSAGIFILLFMCFLTSLKSMTELMSHVSVESSVECVYVCVCRRGCVCVCGCSKASLLTSAKWFDFFSSWVLHVWDADGATDWSHCIYWSAMTSDILPAVNEAGSASAPCGLAGFSLNTLLRLEFPVVPAQIRAEASSSSSFSLSVSLGRPGDRPLWLLCHVGSVRAPMTRGLCALFW